MSTTAITGSKVKTKFESLKVGSVISETQYYTVEDIQGTEAALKNDNDELITVNDDYVDNCVTLADYFTTVEGKTRTELAQIFIAHPFTAMTVNFNKQVKEEDVVKEIQDAYLNSTPKEFETKMKKAVKNGLGGVERTAIGRHYGHINEFGRIQFIDMEKSKGTNPAHDARNITVDPRTINWLIVKGIKYKVK